MFLIWKEKRLDKGAKVKKKKKRKGWCVERRREKEKEKESRYFVISQREEEEERGECGIEPLRWRSPSLNLTASFAWTFEIKKRE